MGSIEGVSVRELVTHGDERGSLTEILRSDWPQFERFGQAIVTVNLPGVIRGWHSHHAQTDAIIVVSGRLRIGLYDARSGSPTHGSVDDMVVGPLKAVIFVPPGVFHGYRTLGQEPALIVNIPDQLYDASAPDEVRVDPHTKDIPFDWDRVR